MKRALLILWFIASAGAVLGQSTGTINGRVVDPGGAVVPDARITATNVGTGISRETSSNADGFYTIPALEPGTYDVKVEATGFAPSIRSSNTLLTGTALTVDLTLAVAGTTQKIEVSGEAPLIETTKSEVSGTLQTSEVQNLPILNRNYVGLVTLIPGARPVQNVNSNKVGFGGAISVSGGTGRNVELEVDGVATRDDVVGGTMFNMTVEGIQEFNVLAHDYGTQYGRTAGGVVLMTTKAGTNQLHGTAFAYGRSDAMTAIDYFSKQAGFANPPYDREQYGGSLGGPIRKNKIFFFGGIERIQQNSVKPYPSSAFNEATTLKSALLGLGSASPDLPGGKGNFASGIIPACPVCVQVGTALQPAQNSPQNLRDLMYTVKGDYQLNAHHSLFVRWSQERIDSLNDLIVNTGAPPHPDIDPNGSNVNDVGRAYSIVGSETWVIGSNSVNTFAVQGNHLKTNQFCNCGAPGPGGIFWLNRNLQFGADLQVGVSQNSTDQIFYQDTVQFKDDFSHQIGNHSLKFGGDFSFFPNIGVTLHGAGGVSQGETSFNNDPSVIVASQKAWQANPSGCTTALQTGKVGGTSCGPYKEGFLTPNVEAQIVAGQVMLGGAAGDAGTQGQKQMGLYLQDDWKIKPRFTLNLGLRYDLDINWYNQQQYAANRTYLALKAIGSPFGRLPQTPAKDVAPRVGFAWDVTGNGRNVLRASYGIFFDQMLMINNFTAALQEKATLGNQVAVIPTALLSSSTAASGQGPQYIYGITNPGPLGPQPGITNFGPRANASGAWLDPNIRDPYDQQAHVGFTKQLTARTAISADYTHILGLFDFRVRQINPKEGFPTGSTTSWDPNAASYLNASICPGVATAANIAAGNYRRLQCALAADATQIIGVPDPTGTYFGGITLTTSTNRSRYDELTVHFEQRSRRATYQLSYTLSGAYGYGGAIYGATGGVGALAPINPDMPFGPGEWGPTVTDERHHFVATGVFELPAGIQVSPIFQIASARPYNLIIPGDPIGTAQNNLARPVSLDTGEPTVNQQRGTATWDFDARVTKFFNLWSETRRIGFFAEFYNITNKANFGNAYNGTVGSVTFEQPLNFLNNGLTGANSRQVQLGARFIF